jgi:hypothetical protein
MPMNLSETPRSWLERFARKIEYFARAQHWVLSSLLVAIIGLIILLGIIAMPPTQDDLIKNLLYQPRLLQDFLHAFLPEVFVFTDFEVLEYLDKDHYLSQERKSPLSYA